MQPRDTEAITQRVWDIVNRLPHREAIVEGDARHWVSEVVARYGDLATWHAVRAGGFGGSQIGVLVRNFVGQRADHQASAHDVVAGALLRRLPDEPNGHMRRGIEMESHHRKVFLSKWGAERDEQAFRALSKGTGPRPWMRYSPDEFCVIPGHGRTLGDYKAPSKVEPGEEVAFQYGCQLHMGRLVALHNGVAVDAMILSQFDWANWNLDDRFVPYVPELDEMITKAGDHYWEFVLRGELPPYVYKRRLDEVPDVVDALRGDAARLAKLKAMVKKLTSEAEIIEAQIKPVLEGMRFGSGKLALDGLNVSARQKVDLEQLRAKLPEEVITQIPLRANSTKRYEEDELLRALRARQVDTKQFLKLSSLDPQAVYDVAMEHGIDADAMAQEQLSLGVDKTLQEQINSMVERELEHLINAPLDDEEGEQNREGQEAPRSVPRSVMA